MLLIVWGGERSAFCDLPSILDSPSNYNFKLLDRWPYGTGFSVLLDSNTLFYTNGGVLQIGRLDLSGKVFWLSEIVFPGLAYTMVRSDKRLYVAVDDQGVAIVDISNLNDPQIMNLFKTGGRSFGLAVRGDTLYTALGSAGLEVYDCLDPASTRLLGTLPGFNLRSLALDGDFLFATDASIGLISIDVSDPATPSSIKGLKLTGQHYGLDYDSLSHTAWVCSFDGGLHIIDLSDPSDPSIAVSIPLMFAWAVDIERPYAYVVSWGESLSVLDAGSYETIGSVSFDTLDVTGIWPYDVSVSGSYGSIAGFLGSWWIFDALNPSKPNVIDGYARGGLSDVVAADDRYIALGLEGSKVAFFDRGNTLSPPRIYPTADWPRDAVIHDNTLYVAEGWAGLALYDISDLEEGVDLISRFSLDEIHVWALALNLPHVYLACGDSGLISVDLTNPLLPQKTAKISFDARAFSLCLLRDSLFVGLEDATIAVLNVVDPSKPIQVVRQNLHGSALDFDVRDSILYIAEANEGVGIYLIDDNKWNTLSLIPMEHFASAVDVCQDVLFIGDGSFGIKAYNISNHAAPQLVGSFNTGGEVRDLFVSSDTVFVADGYDGYQMLLFLDLGCSDSSLPDCGDALIRYNPFVYILEFTKHVNAILYDESGKLVSKVSGNSYNARQLQSGVYFVVGDEWCKKVVKMGRIK